MITNTIKTKTTGKSSGVFARLLHARFLQPLQPLSGIRACACVGAALLSLFLYLSLFATPAAFGQVAQQTSVTSGITSGTTGTDVVQMDKYNVTGSHIPYAADAPAVPVRMIKSDSLQISGFAGNLMDVLRTQAPQFIGSMNIGSNNANTASNWTNGGSMISLRSEPTLILVNGRRAAYAPVGAQTGFTFVDVDAIPVSAVERIELITDGASAIYGSDAVTGVVNIILKKNYQGAEVGAGYKFAPSAGHWSEKTAHAVAGFNKGKTNITVSVEWMKSDPLYQNQRPFSADMTGKTSNVPGAVYDVFGSGDWFLAVPGKVPPPNTHMSPADLVAAGYYTGPLGIGDVMNSLNLSPYVTLLTSNQRLAATVNFERELTRQLQLFGDVLVSNYKTYSQLAAQPISQMPFGAKHVNSDYGVGLAEADNPQNPFDDMVWVRNRFVSHPRGYDTDNKTVRVLAGLRGDINDKWHWEGALNYNYIHQRQNQTGVIDRDAEAAALDAGILNLFATEQAPGAFEKAGIFGAAWQKNSSSLFTADASINGEIARLPAGPLQIAVGAELRRETLSGNVDAGSLFIDDVDDFYYAMPAKWDGANGGSPFSAARTIAAGFAQVRVPVASKEQHIPGLYTMDLDLAARYEYYSDTQNSLVPKFQLRYLPFDNQFAIRMTYAQSFNAPALYDLAAPGGVGYTSSLYDIERHDGTGTMGDGDQAIQGDRSNPKLRPEKSKTYSAGIVYSPKYAKGLEVEVSYFQVKRTNLIGSELSQAQILEDVELNGADSPYAKDVHIGGFNGAPITAPGQISASVDNSGGSFANVYLLMRNYNIGDSMQDGVDFAARYKLNTKTAGNFGFEAVGTWYNRYGGSGDDNLVGTTSYGFGGWGTIPRWRGNVTANWNYKNWDASAFVMYIPRVTDMDYETPVDYFASLDLAVGYNFRKGPLKGMSVRVGCNNVFNRMPPVAYTWNDSNADVGTYGCYGRVFFINASYKF